MVSAVVERKCPRRCIRIAQYPIEIDNGVVLSARADPRIDRLALSLVRGREDRKGSSRDKKPLIRCQGASVNPKTLRMRTLDELLMPLDNLIGAGIFGWIDGNVPQLHDHMSYTCAGESVAIEAGQTVGAKGIMKD